jgi:hypothetical protein
VCTKEPEEKERLICKNASFYISIQLTTEVISTIEFDVVRMNRH